MCAPGAPVPMGKQPPVLIVCEGGHYEQGDGMRVSLTTCGLVVDVRFEGNEASTTIPLDHLLETIGTFTRLTES